MIAGFAMQDAAGTPRRWPADLTLDRMADEADYAVIGPVDGRAEVRDAARHPHHAVCQVGRDFGDGRFGGCSGFLIGPRLVLTAGHCVYSRMRAAIGQPAIPRRIRITLGATSSRPSGHARIFAARWFGSTRFVRGGDAVSDFGIIVLDRAAPPGITPFQAAAKPDATLRLIQARRLLHVAGYPGDKPPGSMWEHAERLDRFDQRSLFYSVDTCPGHSGSPVWCLPSPGSAPVAIAIHVAGPKPHARGAWGCRPGVPMAPRGAYNRGVRLTPLILQAAADALADRSNPHVVRLDGS